MIKFSSSEYSIYCQRCLMKILVIWELLEKPPIFLVTFQKCHHFIIIWLHTRHCFLQNKITINFIFYLLSAHFKQHLVKQFILCVRLCYGVHWFRPLSFKSAAVIWQMKAWGLFMMTLCGGMSVVSFCTWTSVLCLVRLYSDMF